MLGAGICHKSPHIPQGSIMIANALQLVKCATLVVIKNNIMGNDTKNSSPWQTGHWVILLPWRITVAPAVLYHQPNCYNCDTSQTLCGIISCWYEYFQIGTCHHSCSLAAAAAGDCNHIIIILFSIILLFVGQLLCPHDMSHWYWMGPQEAVVDFVCHNCRNNEGNNGNNKDNDGPIVECEGMTKPCVTCRAIQSRRNIVIICRKGRWWWQWDMKLFMTCLLCIMMLGLQYLDNLLVKENTYVPIAVARRIAYPIIIPATNRKGIPLKWE